MHLAFDLTPPPHPTLVKHQTSREAYVSDHVTPVLSRLLVMAREVKAGKETYSSLTIQQGCRYGIVLFDVRTTMIGGRGQPNLSGCFK
jgi:hypothetical protein